MSYWATGLLSYPSELLGYWATELLGYWATEIFKWATGLLLVYWATTGLLLGYWATTFSIFYLQTSYGGLKVSEFNKESIPVGYSILR